MVSPEPDKDFPWWLVALVATGLVILWQILANPVYADALAKLALGIEITVLVTVVAFAGASVLGLGLALMSLSRRLVLRQVARFYIEVVRGVPIIVLLLYVAFVFAPLAVEGLNRLLAQGGLDPVRPRDFPLVARAVLALILAYSAFLAEIFRAGLQAVDRGQIEAAQALGLSRRAIFRTVTFPQAFRIILPPYGNDFVSMVKDSSLVSVLGVTDVAQLGKVIAASNFRYFETYNVVAFLYLTLTITLSLILRRIEMRLRARTPRRGSR